MSEVRYKKALAAVLEVVNKVIAYDETTPEGQCVLDTIEAICRDGADIRTEADKQWRPEMAYEIDDKPASQAVIVDAVNTFPTKGTKGGQK